MLNCNVVKALFYGPRVQEAREYDKSIHLLCQSISHHVVCFVAVLVLRFPALSTAYCTEKYLTQSAAQ